jgi:hypothetical protein
MRWYAGRGIQIDQAGQRVFANLLSARAGAALAVSAPVTVATVFGREVKETSVNRGHSQNRTFAMITFATGS